MYFTILGMLNFFGALKKKHPKLITLHTVVGALGLFLLLCQALDFDKLVATSRVFWVVSR